MKRLFSLVALVAASTVATAQSTTSSPVSPGATVIKMFDKERIDKWAQCSWTRAPISADNWLKARDDKLASARPSTNQMAAPKAVLALRLDAACGELLSPRDRRSISFGVERAKAVSLAALRPAKLPSSEAASKTKVCEVWSQGTLMITYLSTEGKKPKPIPGAQTRCFKTSEDGSLLDA